MSGSIGAILLLVPCLGVVLSGGCGGEALPATAGDTRIVGGPGLEPGRLGRPRALAVDASGRVYTVDRTGRVQLFSSEGELLRLWRMPEVDQGQPVGLAIAPDGDLLVSDTHYQRIFRYDTEAILGAAKLEVRHDDILVRSPGARIGGFLGEGPGEFTWVRDVVVDSSGAIYAGDSGGAKDRIQKFSPEGKLLLVFGKRGDQPGELDLPGGMAIERRGEEEFLLVADCNNHRVQRFTLEGELVSMWGARGEGLGEFRYPRSVAIAPDGSIWVCEWGNNRLQRFTPE
ncbi:MAG TPA: hypothetical protein VK116_03730, partial [Planctomycetota bacterium]|nr:hypothetical protein [Planctomycetota bacterium]